MTRKSVMDDLKRELEVHGIKNNTLELLKDAEIKFEIIKPTEGEK